MVIEVLNDKSIKYLQDVDLKEYTTYKVGGIAKIMVFPKDTNELAFIIDYCIKNKTTYFILGYGSNIIFSDNDYNGIIIKLNNMKQIEIDNNIVTVGAGASLSLFANRLCTMGKSGFEFACGIPGSIGGAVYMNAGAYNSNISDVLISAKIMDLKGNIIECDNSFFEFDYRHSILKNNKNLIVVEAKFKLIDKDKDEIQELISKRKKKRLETQPLEYPSAGSVFRNPIDNFAGKLIEDLNLKGFIIGGAKVSEKHANFIINYNNAKAEDIRDLIKYVKEKVKAEYGVELNEEQEYINW